VGFCLAQQRSVDVGAVLRTEMSLLTDWAVISDSAWESRLHLGPPCPRDAARTPRYRQCVLSAQSHFAHPAGSSTSDPVAGKAQRSTSRRADYLLCSHYTRSGSAPLRVTLGQLRSMLLSRPLACRAVFDLLFDAVAAGGSRSPVIAEHVILPLFRILVAACRFPPAIRRPPRRAPRSTHPGG